MTGWTKTHRAAGAVRRDARPFRLADNAGRLAQTPPTAKRIALSFDDVPRGPPRPSLRDWLDGYALDIERFATVAVGTGGEAHARFDIDGAADRSRRGRARLPEE